MGHPMRGPYVLSSFSTSGVIGGVSFSWMIGSEKEESIQMVRIAQTNKCTYTYFLCERV